MKWNRTGSEEKSLSLEKFKIEVSKNEHQRFGYRKIQTSKSLNIEKIQKSNIEILKSFKFNCKSLKFHSFQFKAKNRLISPSFIIMKQKR